MTYHRRGMGSTQSRPSLYVRVPRAVDGYDFDVRVGGPRGKAHVQTSLGSTQSRPSQYVRVPRAALGASAAEYNLVSSALSFVLRTLGAKPAARAAAPARAPMRMPTPAPMRGFGSLGDSTDLEPATSLSNPTMTGAPTIGVDPATAAWQGSMLEQTKIIAAAQQDFTDREVRARYLQIAATLAIPVAAAAWRAVGRVLAGRREERDFE